MSSPPRRWVSHRLLPLSTLASLTLLAPLAVAQNASNQAAAEALFDQGKAAMAAHNYAEACPKFFESNRLDTGLGTTLWLADCYEQNGQTASAWAEFREAAALAARTTDPREKVARSRAKALEPKLARLVLVVPPAVQVPGLEVARDGVLVASPVWGTPVPIDPGPHTFVAKAPAHLPATLHIDSRRGPGQQSLEVPPLADAPPPPSMPGVTPLSERPADGAPAGFPVQRALAIGAFAVGFGSVAVASYFGLHAKAEVDDSNAGPCQSNNHCTPVGLADRSSAESAATVSTVFFIVGGAALAGGAALWFTTPKSTAAPPASAVSMRRQRLVPWVDPRVGSAGVVLDAEF